VKRASGIDCENSISRFNLPPKALDCGENHRFATALGRPLKITNSFILVFPQKPKLRFSQQSKAAAPRYDCLGSFHKDHEFFPSLRKRCDCIMILMIAL
jgi:hypothetical protein